MRLATFTQAGSTRGGAVVGGQIVDLAAAGLPAGMAELFAVDLDRLRDAVDSGSHRLDLRDVALEAPVPRPGKILAIGLNYADHAAETGRDVPEIPVVFNKQTTCVNRDGGAIEIPRASSRVDYEGELAFVIGRRCRHVRVEDAREVIVGYTILNDVSVRDWQKRSPTMTMGKSFDTHGPMGPWIVTPDEIGDPHALAIRTFVNGDCVQDSNTRHLIFNCFDIVAHLTEAFTLEPGDVISTGTPSGVGSMREPPLWLKAGDTVRVEIEKIGALTNPVVDEPLEPNR
jgi:2-keto-4-pentenoate hydratase/2-oxohepta-3-ene-1,7-dioic acid hydratase in catechol pathway